MNNLLFKIILQLMQLWFMRLLQFGLLYQNLLVSLVQLLLQIRQFRLILVHFIEALNFNNFMTHFSFDIHVALPELLALFDILILIIVFFNILTRGDRLSFTQIGGGCAQKVSWIYNIIAVRFIHHFVFGILHLYVMHLPIMLMSLL